MDRASSSGVAARTMEGQSSTHLGTHAFGDSDGPPSSGSWEVDLERAGSSGLAARTMEGQSFTHLGTHALGDSMMLMMMMMTTTTTTMMMIIILYHLILVGDGRHPTPTCRFGRAQVGLAEVRFSQHKSFFRNFWSHGPQNRCIWSKISRGN